MTFYLNIFIQIVTFISSLEMGKIRLNVFSSTVSKKPIRKSEKNPFVAPHRSDKRGTEHHKFSG